MSLHMYRCKSKNLNQNCFVPCCHAGITRLQKQQGADHDSGKVSTNTNHLNAVLSGQGERQTRQRQMLPRFFHMDDWDHSHIFSSSPPDSFFLRNHTEPDADRGDARSVITNKRAWIHVMRTPSACYFWVTRLQDEVTSVSPPLLTLWIIRVALRENVVVKIARKLNVFLFCR